MDGIVFIIQTITMIVEEDTNCMFTIELLKKIRQIEKETGQNIAYNLSEVPFGNVIALFYFLPVDYLAKMMNIIPIPKLVNGLKALTPNQIKEIPPSKILTLLMESDTNTLELLQKRYTEIELILAIQKLSISTLIGFLETNDLSVITETIDNILK